MRVCICDAVYVLCLRAFVCASLVCARVCFGVFA